MVDIRFLAERLEQVPKVYIPSLATGTIIRVVTENSTYTLNLLNPAECLVEARGGYFARRKREPCRVTVMGCSCGGSMLYKGYLIAGLVCEFEGDVVTTMIREISIALSN
jgi:hypothetical protein